MRSLADQHVRVRSDAREIPVDRGGARRAPYARTMDPSTTTTPPSSVTSSTLIGPNGTAPGMNFIEQQDKPLNDSSNERAAGLPLLFAGVVLLVVFSTVLIRAWVRKQRTSHST